ncbi:hypothetical protein GCM10027445_33840 [Amycolatopsis endophytica]
MDREQDERREPESQDDHPAGARPGEELLAERLPRLHDHDAAEDEEYRSGSHAFQSWRGNREDPSRLRARGLLGSAT